MLTQIWTHPKFDEVLRTVVHNKPAFASVTQRCSKPNGVFEALAAGNLCVFVLNMHCVTGTLGMCTYNTKQRHSGCRWGCMGCAYGNRRQEAGGRRNKGAARLTTWYL